MLFSQKLIFEGLALDFFYQKLWKKRYKKIVQNGSKLKLFFGSIFRGSWGRFWEAFGEDFGGPGRLLGGTMGEKREQK